MTQSGRIKALLKLGAPPPALAGLKSHERVIDPLHDDIRHKQPKARTAGGFRGCWSSVDAQNRGGGVSFVSSI